MLFRSDLPARGVDDVAHFADVRFKDAVRRRVGDHQRRPFTLVWIFSQFVAGFMVMLPAIWYFGEIGLAGLILIPLLINAVGDGLAEPIGVRWGRHEYRTRALGTDRTYVRTLEGSGFILLTGLVIIALHASQFSGLQFALALAIVPLAMTLAEAFSPHTWDTPFLMAAGYGGLLLVMQF